MNSYVPDEILLSQKTDAPLNIFISYAHAQAPVVKEIYNRLGESGRGHHLFFDKKDIPHDADWREKIYKSISNSNGVISFLSRDAVRDRGVCLDELSIAVGVKYGNIRTVLLEDEKTVQPPPQLTHRNWLDMSDWQEQEKKGKAAYSAWLDYKAAMLIRAVESDESREFVGLISDIREKLHIGDISSVRQNWYLAQPFVGRKWLTKQVEDWLNDPDGGTMCALYGGPGVGKSAFAAQYAYHSCRVAASVFFKHGHEHFNTPSALIRELILQLACRLPVYRHHLHSIVTTQNTDAMNDSELIENLLSKPLRDCFIDGNHETLCIVIDGLDECTVGESNALAQLLGDYSQYFPRWLRLLTLSRRDTEVTGAIRPAHTIDMDANSDDNWRDVRQYFQDRLSTLLENRADAPQLLDALAARAGGVFLYAYIVSDMILAGKLDIADVNAYPADLNSSFRLWFARYFPDIPAYKHQFRLYLGMIAASPEPLPTEEIDLVDVHYDDADDCYYLPDSGAVCRAGSRMARLQRINPLLVYGTNAFGKQTVAFTHRYIAEWLTQFNPTTNERPAGAYYCAPGDAFWAMESVWRNHLRDGEPLTEYQALHLFSYAQQAETDATALAVAKDERLISATEAFYDKYDEQFSYSLALLFAEADANRTRFIWEKEKSDEAELEYAKSIANIASAERALGHYQYAVSLREQVYSIINRILGNEHEYTLTAINNLAIALNSLGKHNEALKLQIDVLEVFERTLPKEHLDTLLAMSNLAVTLEKLGKHNEALKLQKDVLEAHERTLPKDHPATLRAMGNLAATLIHLGKRNEALKLSKEVLEARERTLPKDHPHTLTAMGNLAVTLNDLGKHTEALELEIKVLEARERTLPKDHPATLRAMGNLAFTLGELGKHTEALELEIKVLEARERTLPKDHPATLLAMGNLAGTLSDLGKHNEALELKIKVLEARERTLPKDHPDTLLAMSNLAVTLSDLGKHTEALELKTKVLEARERTLSKDHPDTLLAMGNLAVTLGKLGKHNEALELKIKVLEAHERTLPKDHPDTLTAMSNLAFTLGKLGKHNEALELEIKVLEARDRTLPKDHPDTLLAMNNLAVTLSNLGKYTEALPYCETLLESTIRRYGQNSEEADDALELLNDVQSKVPSSTPPQNRCFK